MDGSTQTRAQLDLLARMAELDPPPHVMGGYAEDAVVGGTVSRPHDDVDWAVMRRDLPLRLEQLRGLGFGEPETWGESAPGSPFYLYAARDDGLSVDVGVFEEVDGHPTVDVGTVRFRIDGQEPPGGFRVHLPADAFSYPTASVDGVPVRALSPLALYQVRVGIASKGAFGELTEKQRRSLARLRETYFGDLRDDELMPLVESIAR